MSEFQPPLALEAAGIKHPAQLVRQALSSLLKPEGGTVSAGGLAVSAHVAPNMSVNVNGGAPPAGEAWVPGSTSPDVQGLYFVWNDGVVNKAIGASNEANPRVDTVVAHVKDSQYTGAEDEWEIEVLAGAPEAGATLENLKGAAALPDSCLVLAYVLVPAKATKIEAADIKNVATSFALEASLTLPSVGSPAEKKVIESGEELEPSASHATIVNALIFLKDRKAQQWRAEVDGVDVDISTIGETPGGAFVTHAMKFVVPAGKKYRIYKVGETNATIEVNYQQLL